MNLNVNFLDKEYEKIIDNVVKENYQVFNYLNRFNNFLYEVIKEFEGGNGTKQNQYIYSSFVLFSKYYQSCVIMIKYGLHESAEVLMRNILEIFFYIEYVINDKDNIESMILKYVITKTKNINDIEKQNFENELSPENLYKYKIEIKKIKDEYSKKNICKQPNIQKICEQLGLQEDYLKYQYLCEYSHNSFMVLNDLLINNKENVYPKFDDLKGISYRLIDISSKIVNSIINYYSFDKLIERYNFLIKEVDEIFN